MAGRRSSNRSSTPGSYSQSFKHESVPGLKTHNTTERVLQPVPEAPKIPSLQSTFTPAAGQFNPVQSISQPQSIITDQQDEMDVDHKISPFKKFFSNKRKGPVRRKEKKARQNRRLRKMLTPKTALMALNELKGNLSQYNVTGQGTNFTAEIDVNGVKYEGFGNSKIAAKNNASEKALRELIIQKMSKVPKKSVEVLNQKPSEGNGLEKENDVEMKNADSDDDDVPMLHLASFALHKLFSEWEAQGYQIPDFRIAGQSAAQSMEDISAQDEMAQKKLPKPRIELPPNAESLHPCTVLSHMRPGVQYIDLGSDGTPPNMLHKIGVTVDEKKYIGEARSKKNARKFVAIDACNELFGTRFVKDTSTLNEQAIPSLS